MQCVIDGGSLRTFAPYVFKSKVFRSIYRDRSVYKCTICGLRQVNVEQVDNDALTRYYEHDYRNVAKIGVASSRAQHLYYKARGTALAELINKPPRRVFELGAGYGYNLLAIKSKFPNAKLFTDEIDKSLGRFADIECTSITNGPWDIVILSHVLEHFTDPVGLLQSILPSIAENGLIIIEVPNDIEGIFPINGPDEPHITFFTAETLNLLLTKTGYVVRDLFTAGPDNTPKSLAQVAKRLARATASSIPGLSAAVERRRSRINAKLDLGRRNQNGVYLRAILSPRLGNDSPDR